MSYIFSRALVEACLQGKCSDTDASALLSGSPTPPLFLPSDKTMAFSRLSRFGMTFAPLTADRGAELLTLWLAGFHARTSALPEKAQASTGNGQECGRTWRGSLAKFDPASSSWKTAQHSLLEDLEGCSVTWPRSGSMRNGECWERLTLEPRTSATGFGLWPTPQAHKTTKSGELVNSDGTPWDGISKPHSAKTGRQVTSALADAVAFWPTPTVCGNYNRKGASATSGDGLATAVRMWPTPVSSDTSSRSKPYAQGGTPLSLAVKYQTPTAHNSKEGAHPSEYERNCPTLATHAGGPLNPMWVEWLMGWPLGWTDLKPLATDKSHSAPLKHSGSLQPELSEAA